MRLRRDPEPAPEAIRELEAIDAALAGAAVGPVHRELADLAVALRDERPEPRPEFALALDLRVTEGFRRDEESGIHRAEPARRRELHTPHRLRTTPLAIGTAAALFIVATAVFTTGVLTGGGSTDQPTRATGPVDLPLSKGGGVSSEAQSGDAASPQAMAAPSTPSLQSTARARRRQVERSAALTLSAARERIEDVADDVIQVTDRHRGFVMSSSVSAGDSGNAGARFDLRIPSSRLQEAVSDLSGLAHVRARTQDALDITARFSSPRRHLRDALAERRGLLRQLARATTPNETAAIRARLRAASRRIDRAQAQLRALRQRVTLSRVSVAIEPGKDVAATDSGWTLTDAVRDAIAVLGAIAGAAIVGIAAGIPAALIGLIAWFAYRAVVRRRRERALDVHGPGAPARG
jgi:hypothetical protein